MFDILWISDITACWSCASKKKSIKEGNVLKFPKSIKKRPSLLQWILPTIYSSIVQVLCRKIVKKDSRAGLVVLVSIMVSIILRVLIKWSGFIFFLSSFLPPALAYFNLVIHTCVSFNLGILVFSPCFLCHIITLSRHYATLASLSKKLDGVDQIMRTKALAQLKLCKRVSESTLSTQLHKQIPTTR